MENCCCELPGLSAGIQSFLEKALGGNLPFYWYKWDGKKPRELIIDPPKGKGRKKVKLPEEAVYLPAPDWARHNDGFKEVVVVGTLFLRGEAEKAAGAFLVQLQRNFF